MRRGVVWPYTAVPSLGRQLRRLTGALALARLSLAAATLLALADSAVGGAAIGMSTLDAQPVATPEVGRAPAQARSDTFPLGELVERVIARSDSTQSYALYLPSSYRASGRWPVLFVMDPRGRAVTALRLFQSAAERHGYIVLSSYGTLGDSTLEPNEVALQAMLTDAQRLFSMDPRRIYLAGFSGTARVGWLFAQRLSGHVAGLIGFGGGQPGGALLTLFSSDVTFAFFGGAGTTDFNYEEMRALDGWLDQIELPHRFEFFQGPHAWPPEEVCSRSLEWMELQAMKSGLRPQDEVWLDLQFEEQLAEARALEAAGELYAALVSYRAISEDFADLLEVGEAAVKTAELEREWSVRRTIERMGDLAEWQKEYDDRFLEFLDGYRTRSRLPSLERSLRQIKLEELQRRVGQTGDTLEAQAARRVLEHIFVRLSYYEPQDFLEQGDPQRALGILLIARELKPRHPYVCYNLARAHAQLGNTEEALHGLECAVAAGVVSAARIEDDAYLESLRGAPGYREIVERAKANRQDGSTDSR